MRTETRHDPPRLVAITAKLDAHDVAELERRALAGDRTRSAEVRRLVRAALHPQPKETP